MKTDFIDLALQAGAFGRGDEQWSWYPVFKSAFRNKTVLDVGTGISKIKERTSKWNATVTTHEACSDLNADIHGDLSLVASKSFQTVTCFDVIEHVKDYGKLAFNMARIASESLVITTPGFALTKCTNPCHWHEFMPDELCNLIEATGMVFAEAYGSFWKSYPDAPLGFRAFNYAELRTNIDMHPIGIRYIHQK
jgi:hypothetical protein